MIAGTVIRCALFCPECTIVPVDRPAPHRWRKGNNGDFCLRFSDLTTSNNRFLIVYPGTSKESALTTARGYVHHPVDFDEYQYSEGKLISHQQAGNSPRLFTTDTGIPLRNSSGNLSLY